MDTAERLDAYIRQNEAGGRRRPDLLTPRQARRAERKLRRDERLADAMAESFIASVRATEKEPATETSGDFGPVPMPCPRCGATGDQPCTTPSGKPAAKTHKGREL